jgi:AcrR family transcriptional regulator
MGRPALKPDEIHEFRERLCDAALTIFADEGYDGFTLRALGDAVGCSPTTPYRYFASKAEIFAGVCSRAFESLCDAQEQAAAKGGEPWDRVRAQGRAYVGWARGNPSAYRVMFNLEGAHEALDPRDRESHSAPISRSWELLLQSFVAAADAGLLDGDPATVAHSFWASIHGVMALELADRMIAGLSSDTVLDEVIGRFERAYTPTP